MTISVVDLSTSPPTFLYNTTAAYVTLGEAEAQAHYPTAAPLEERKGIGLYDFVPAGAAPNVAFGFQRGSLSYIIDDVAGTVTEVWNDAIPMLDVDIPADLERRKAKKIAELRALCKNDIEADVTVGVNAVSYIWNGDSEALDNIRDEILGVEHSMLPTPTTWRNKDDVQIAIIMDDIHNIATAIALKKKNAILNLFSCEEAVFAATNQQDLDSIAW